MTTCDSESVVYIPYVCLDCNIMQPHAKCGHFSMQTTFQFKHCGRTWQEETLGRNSWRVNVYCTRAGSCEDKHGYLQNAGGRDL